MISVAYLALMAWLNTVRGGHLGGERLRTAVPGHPRLWVSLAVGVASTPFYGPLWGLLAGVAYLLSVWLPWGLWYDLGRLPDDYGPVSTGPENYFEKIVTRITPNDHVAFGVRNLIAYGPMALMFGPVILLLAPMQVVAYEIGWRWTPNSAIRTGEIITGYLIGAMLLGASY